jgi:hypothetical protein
MIVIDMDNWQFINVADWSTSLGGSECNLQLIYEEWKKQYSAKILRNTLPKPPVQLLSPLPAANLFERKEGLDLVRATKNVASLRAYVKECHKMETNAWLQKYPTAKLNVIIGKLASQHDVEVPIDVNTMIAAKNASVGTSSSQVAIWRDAILAKCAKFKRCTSISTTSVFIASLTKR